MDGFDGDTYVQAEVVRLIRSYGVQTAIETGTFEGRTAKFLAQHVPIVHTIDIRRWPGLVQLPQNVTCHLGNSPDVLDTLLPQVIEPVLILLDAHWGNCPLWDELRIIAKHGLKPIIVVHDFLVPGLGYDHWMGRDISHANILPEIRAVYGDQYHHYTNDTDHAAGNRRGVGYYLPKYPANITDDLGY